MNKRSLLAAAMAITLGAALLMFSLHPGVDNSQQPPVSVIVQGADLDTAAAAVEAVGGEITHRLGVINAVGARLTTDQQAALRSADGISHVYADHPVNVSARGGRWAGTDEEESQESQSAGETEAGWMSYDAMGESHLVIDANRVAWTVWNMGWGELTIDRISITWPRVNNRLMTVALDGRPIFQEIRQAPFTTIDSDWTGTVNRRKIGVGDGATFRFEFDSETLDLEAVYTIQVHFAEGVLAEFFGRSGNENRLRNTNYPTLVGADVLQQEGVDGLGVTVAVVDTGFDSIPVLKRNIYGETRLLVHYDAISDEVGGLDPEDGSGHGTHVSSVILSSRLSLNDEDLLGSYNGIAPNADIVSVKAFDEQGTGTYLDVIRGIDFVVQNKDVYGIRVLNLSFSSEPRSHYWDDPLNQAVMAAWQAGIVVVAAAGNTGPEAMTVGVPGNVPYVITVGAMSDNDTPENGSDDILASFSSTGPTVEGFVKPEVVAPGGHIIGIMNGDDEIPRMHGEFHDGFDYFVMSGTSQAAAVVSGVAALIIQQNPDLTPDQVKGRLMRTARPAVDENGDLAYSIFQQGAGLVNAYDAAHSAGLESANQGLDIDLDLAGEAHFGGLADRDEEGNYFLAGIDGYMWSDGYAFSSGYMWSDAQVFSGGYMWSDAQVFSDGYMWSDSYAFSSGYMWSDGLSESMSINVWVPQE